MAQLKSTTILGSLSVTDSIKEGGTALSSKYISSLTTGSSGSGNVVSAITVSGNQITYVKGITALTGITSNQVTAALGYTPPTTNTTYGAATTTYAGLVKMGNNISIDGSGIISPTKTGVTAALGYTPPTTNTTYSDATTTYAGLMGTGAQTFAGNKTFNAAVNITDTKSAGTALLTTTNNTTTATDYLYGANFFAPNMPANSNQVINIGKNTGQKQCAYIGYHFAANNSTSNYLKLGMYGADTDDMLIINGNKNVGIGTTSPSEKLTVNGNVSATSFNATSSRKAKKDIVLSAICALDIINSTEIVDFKFKEDEKEIPHIGFIAEDTNPILSTPEQDKMDYTNCIGVLLKAVQELSAKVENLEKKINELEK